MDRSPGTAVPCAPWGTQPPPAAPKVFPDTTRAFPHSFWGVQAPLHPSELSGCRRGREAAGGARCLLLCAVVVSQPAPRAAGTVPPLSPPVWDATGCWRSLQIAGSSRGCPGNREAFLQPSRKCHCHDFQRRFLPGRGCIPAARPRSAEGRVPRALPLAPCACSSSCRARALLLAAPGPVLGFGCSPGRQHRAPGL